MAVERGVGGCTTRPVQSAANHSGDGGGVNAPEAPVWPALLGDAIRDPDALCDALALPDACRPGARAAAKLFPLLVPRGFVALMRRGDPHDPLLRQVLPLGEEELESTGFSADPLA